MIKLDLDDAVTVLRNISQTPSKDMYTMVEVKSMFHEHMTAYLTNNNLRTPNSLADAPPLGSGGSGGSGGKNKRKQNGGGGGGSGAGAGTKRPILDSGNPSKRHKKMTLTDLIPDASDHCLDCGSTEHRRGSTDCKQPSWSSRKIQEAKKNGNDRGSQDFRGGSGSNGNRA